MSPADWERLGRYVQGAVLALCAGYVAGLVVLAIQAGMAR